MSATQSTASAPRFAWTGSGIFILAFHAIMLVSLPWYFATTQPSWLMVLTTIVLTYFSILGITTLYHRLYAHRAYHMARPVEVFFMFLGTLTLQGPALRWSFDHRAHHRHVDHEGDPYNVRKGFWHAHVLWLFGPPRLLQPGDKAVADLVANPVVAFQYKHYVWLAILSNALVTLAIGWLLGDMLAAFILGFGLRLLLSYHITWCINSLAHYWGAQSYSKELSARDNYVVAMITVGEGYHNYHHTFPGDYRNGIRWYHVDPGKWIIWLLSKFGLAWGLQKQPTPKILRTLVTLDTKLLLKRIQDAAASGATDVRTKLEARFESLPKLEALITDRSTSLKQKIEEVAVLHDQWRAKRAVSRSEARVLRQQLKALRRSQKTAWGEWLQLCGQVLRT